MKRRLFVVACFSLILCTVCILPCEAKIDPIPIDFPTNTSTQDNSTTIQPCDIPRNTTVDVHLYVMSKCPYGSQMITTLQTTFEHIDIGLIRLYIDFIANEPKHHQFTSLHGASEVQGDLLMLCAIKHYPHYDEYMPYLGCLSKNHQRIPDVSGYCLQEAELDAQLITQCANGTEGLDLLSASVQRTKDRGVEASPTLYINNIKYTGERKPELLLESICSDSSDEDVLSYDLWMVLIVISAIVVVVVSSVLLVGFVLYYYCYARVTDKWLSMLTSSSVNQSLAFPDMIIDAIDEERNVHPNGIAREEESLLGNGAFGRSIRAGHAHRPSPSSSWSSSTTGING